MYKLIKKIDDLVKKEIEKNHKDIAKYLGSKVYGSHVFDWKTTARKLHFLRKLSRNLELFRTGKY